MVKHEQQAGRLRRGICSEQHTMSGSLLKEELTGRKQTADRMKDDASLLLHLDNSRHTSFEHNPSAPTTSF